MKELETLEWMYLDKFGEGFPMFQLGRTRTDEELAGIIQRCLDEGKTVYDLGLVTAAENVEY